MPRKRNPEYKRISNHYEHLIQSARLKPGQMLPPELELARQHGVTRTTLRRAFAILVNKGLVRKRVGQGTFVSSARAVSDRACEFVAVITRETQADENATGEFGAEHCYESCAYHQIIEGVTDALASYGRVFRIYHLGRKVSQLEDLVESIQDNGDASIIFVGASYNTEIEALETLGKPIVLVDSLEGRNHADVVNAANRVGMKDATLHLLKTTRGPLAFVGANTEESGQPHFMRFQGFLDAHAICDSAFDEAYHFTVDVVNGAHGYRLGREIAGLSPLPSGIVCSDDGPARGILRVFKEHGIAVPGDTNIIGFGDSVYCMMGMPTLSSVAPNRRLMGERAVELLEDRLANPGRERITAHVTTRLILRQSCAPARDPKLEALGIPSEKTP